MLLAARRRRTACKPQGGVLTWHARQTAWPYTKSTADTMIVVPVDLYRWIQHISFISKEFQSQTKPNPLSFPSALRRPTIEDEARDFLTKLATVVHARSRDYVKIFPTFRFGCSKWNIGTVYFFSVKTWGQSSYWITIGVLRTVRPPWQNKMAPNGTWDLTGSGTLWHFLSHATRNH